MNKILVTGNAGFIGYHITKKLIDNKFVVAGIDNINSYYDVNLKKARLKLLSNAAAENNNWNFFQESLENRSSIEKIFEDFKPNTVIHLAAQAGVRYSIENPFTYIDSNIVGFINILEACRKNKIKNLIYASSSSVYGGNINYPFSEKDTVDHPVSIYAATKRANELMAHSYSHLYSLPCIGLRFFTVYGPFGRPDMAPMLFTKAILSGDEIRIFNNGEMNRDFTYISDIVEILYRLINKPAVPNKSFSRSKPNPSSSWAPHRIFNIGNNKSIQLLDFIKVLEDELKIKAVKRFEEMQAGDIQSTLSDNKEISNYVNYSPRTSINVGVKKFIKWYQDFY